MNRILRRSTTPIVAIVLLALAACSPADRAGAADPEYAAVAERLDSLVRREMAEKGIPAMSIALVDGPRTVWSRAYGEADDETVYRVGSVSKLFTDIAVMQLVERGEIDLDAPVQTYLPDFQPANPSGEPITLRHLMSHRAGLVREPSVGSYFDADSPSLAATIASLNGTELVYRPGEKSKYSNAGIATVGYVLERTQGEPFAAYVERAVLQPLGMTKSSFVPRADLQEDLAKAQMWTYHGTTAPAPTFELGIAPAGSMYTTVTDLGRFLSALFADGQGEKGRLLQAATIEEMWTPQFAEEGAENGFGIGFAVSRLDGHRRIGHGGAIYGFATELAFLPDSDLGVVVTASKDVANAVTTHIADEALRLMLAASTGAPLPAVAETGPITAARAAALEGRYAGGGQEVELIARNDTLFVERGGFRARVGTRGDTLVVDDVIDYGARILPVGDRLVIGGDTLARVAAAASMPPAAPARWRPLIGEYGWDHNVLYIREEDGKLHALIEWFFDYPLEEVSENVFDFPNRGLYDGESLVFERDAAGKVTGVRAAGVLFPRRAVGTESGETFRITPIRPVPELRAEALAATPPKETGDFREPELVELTSLDPTIKLDIRYASTNNFMSTVFYDEPRAFLQRPAAEALVRVHRALKPLGYGLLIHDAYRPWYVTKMFWEATPEESRMFVADPSQGSRHNRGSAVDLTLYDLETGEPIEMVGGYDEFSGRSYPDYPGGTSLQRWHRELLRDAMEAEHFNVYGTEWWHFDHDQWQHYPIGTATFDQIPGAAR